MNCVICDKVFTGIENFKQHEVSVKHKKKLEMHKMLTTESKTNSYNTVEIQEIQNLQQTISCHPCSITFSNLIEFQNHSVSEEHARMILKGKSEPSSANNDLFVSDCSVDSTHDLKQQVSQLNVEPDLLVNFSRCDCCSKSFTGPESYLQHIASATHKKKALIASTDACQTGSSSVNNGLECKMCAKKFSGPESYQQHLDSANHKKKLLLPSCIKALIVGASVCNICEEQFADPELYQQHINTDSHKNKAMCMSNVKSSLVGDLNCDICEKKFSGPVPYDQHMKSETHRKKVNMKVLLKQVKEENENKISSLHETVSPALSDYYCNFCKKQCLDPDSHKEHISSVHHARKFVESAAEFKRKELENLLSSQKSVSSVEPLCQMAQSENEIDSQKNKNFSPVRNSVEDIKKFLFDDDMKCSPVIIPVNFNITVFEVGDEIDFDKKVNDCSDELNIVSDEDIMYEDCPSP